MGLLAMYVVVTASVVFFVASLGSSPELIHPGRLSTMIDKPGLKVCRVDHDRHGPRLPRPQRHRAREYRGLPDGGPAGRYGGAFRFTREQVSEPAQRHNRLRPSRKQGDSISLGGHQMTVERVVGVVFLQDVIPQGARFSGIHGKPGRDIASTRRDQ